MVKLILMILAAVLYLTLWVALYCLGSAVTVYIGYHTLKLFGWGV